MKQLPEAEIYKLEMLYMPWGLLINKVLAKVIKKVPLNGSVLDIMCGPGYLLELINAKRPDLALVGVDFDSRYISYATVKNSAALFIKADIRSWDDDKQYDCVLCTGSVHHLPYCDQLQLFAKMAKLTKNTGVCICADLCINEYASELERKLAAAELGYEYLKAVLINGAPVSIINAAINILCNDILLDGEYKNTHSGLIGLAKKAFKQVESIKVWPESNTKYGDYIFVMTK